MPDIQLRPGDLVQHTTLLDMTWLPRPGQTPADRPPQRYVVTTLLRLGVRLQAVDWVGHPTGEGLLLGHEQLSQTVHAAASEPGTGNCRSMAP